MSNPTFSDGILMPAQQNRFSINFPTLTPTEAARRATMQAINVSMNLKAKVIEMEIEHPIFPKNYLHLVIDKLITQQHNFVVNIMSGNDEILESVCIYDARCVGHKVHLTYTTGDSIKHALKFSFDSYKLK